MRAVALTYVEPRVVSRHQLWSAVKPDQTGPLWIDLACQARPTSSSVEPAVVPTASGWCLALSHLGPPRHLRILNPYTSSTTAAIIPPTITTPSFLIAAPSHLSIITPRPAYRTSSRPQPPAPTLHSFVSSPLGPQSNWGYAHHRACSSRRHTRTG